LGPAAAAVDEPPAPRREHQATQALHATHPAKPSQTSTNRLLDVPSDWRITTKVGERPHQPGEWAIFCGESRFPRPVAIVFSADHTVLV